MVLPNHAFASVPVRLSSERFQSRSMQIDALCGAISSRIVTIVKSVGLKSRGYLGPLRSGRSWSNTIRCAERLPFRFCTQSR
jgi:hypothetical protein